MWFFINWIKLFTRTQLEEVLKDLVLKHFLPWLTNFKRKNVRPHCSRPDRRENNEQNEIPLPPTHCKFCLTCKELKIQVKLSNSSSLYYQLKFYIPNKLVSTTFECVLRQKCSTLWSQSTFNISNVAHT